jgi:hypothetical protein
VTVRGASHRSPYSARPTGFSESASKITVSLEEVDRVIDEYVAGSGARNAAPAIIGPPQMGLRRLRRILNQTPLD